MSVWKGSREIVAGWLDITTPEDDHEAEGDVVVFDPTRVVDGIELSDDPVLRYRPLAYNVSIERRSHPQLHRLVKALVIGTGGREHALALALSRDPEVDEVHAAPGNPGIAAAATLHEVDPMSGESVAALAVEIGADLVVVGPEAPLVAGVADAVTAAGILCFGPSRAAAQLEGSKAFAKDVMTAAGVPTAAARLCRTADEVAAALRRVRTAVRRQRTTAWRPARASSSPRTAPRPSSTRPRAGT